MKKKRQCNCTYPLNLQFFAEGGSGGEGGEGGEGGTSGSGAVSFDDFLKGEGNQAEFDHRVQQAVSAAVSEAQQKWQALTDDKLSEADVGNQNK